MSTATVTAERPGAPVLRFELLKLVSQWRVRALLVLCWVAPALFVIGVSRQGSLPADTLFGRWMLGSGYAGALVVLSFSSAWVLPLLSALVAGDVFGSEDRLGTWRHLLLATRSPRRVFWAKTASSALVVLLMTTGLAVSSCVGGLVAVGGHGLVGLDGQPLSSAHSALLVVAAWGYAVLPTMAFAAVGLLGSVWLGRSPLALSVPVLLALALQLTQLLPLPTAVRLALPSQAFVAWRGLFTEHPQTRAVLVGACVSLSWAVLALVLARVAFLRRDFSVASYDGRAGGAVVRGAGPLVGLTAVTALLLAPVAGSGIDAPKLQQAMATSFAHLYRLQSQELHRPDVTEAQLRTTAACHRGDPSLPDTGPGHDWRCVVSWHIPGAVAVGTAVYQLDVTPDGKVVADGDGPTSVNGYFVVRTPSGSGSQQAQPNPLFQVDGLIDLSSTSGATEG